MEEQYTEGCSEESCAGCSHSGSCESQKQNAGNTAPSKAPANVGSQVKKVIGVISGKGGVGKSLVTASLARMMIEKGYTAGILDADITGPSIPKMYGVHEMAIGNEMGMLPWQRTGWNKDHVRQPAFGRGGHTGHLERSCDRRRCDTVLVRCDVGRFGLSVR